MLMIRLINGIIVVGSLYCLISDGKRDGVWSVSNLLYTLRYFTRLSNLLSAAAALLVLLTLRGNGLPYWVWVLKFVGTAAVSVTFLTVMVFLGPTQGYPAMLAGTGFFEHLAGPLLAVLSFCFLERFQNFSFSTALLSLLPVLLYGIVYAYKVLLAPENKRWKDFYGFIRGGNWKLPSIAMLLAAFAVGQLLRFLYNI